MPTVASTQNDVGSHLFGGANRRGFLGGGYYEGSPENYELPEYGPMNFRYDVAAQRAQDAMGGQYLPGSPLAQQDAVRQALNQSLMAQMMGTGPSVAQQQLQNSTQGNVANALALAQASPGARGAGRMAMQSMGNINTQAAGQGALLRAQEVQNAQQGLGALRGQDLSMYDMFNRNLLGSLGGQQSLNQGVQQGNMQYERDRMNAFLNQPQSALQNVGNIASQIGGAVTGFGGLMGGGGGGGGGGMGMYGQANPMTTMINPASMPSGFAGGGRIPGYSMGGTTDSQANDTVPAMLSPGEVVLPKSVVNDEDAPKKAAAFLKAVLAKEKTRMAYGKAMSRGGMAC